MHFTHPGNKVHVAFALLHFQPAFVLFTLGFNCITFYSVRKYDINDVEDFTYDCLYANR